MIMAENAQISKSEIWNLLEDIGIDSMQMTTAYIHFAKNLEDVQIVVGCPWEKKKEVAEKLVFGSSIH